MVSPTFAMRMSSLSQAVIAAMPQIVIATPVWATHLPQSARGARAEAPPALAERAFAELHALQHLDDARPS
jgi:hypothetical protein